MFFKPWLQTVVNRLQYAKFARKHGLVQRKTAKRSFEVTQIDVGLVSEDLEDRINLVSDLGDAPDTSPGTGPGDYQTLGARGGPEHENLTQDLVLGNVADGEGDGIPNAAADGDDTTNTGAGDDEDGIAQSELLFSVGANASVDVTVNNDLTEDATLYGWVDFNGNGQFEMSERASIAVPASSGSGTVTLNFGDVPDDSVENTYARFRLSPDAQPMALQGNIGLPTGRLDRGEVEDYRVDILPGVSVDIVGTPGTGQTADEGVAGTDDFTVTFDRNTVTTTDSAYDQAILVQFTVTGTATFAAAGQDYTVAGADSFNTTTGVGTITIGAANKTASITIDTVSDTVVELDETIIITVDSDPLGAGNETYFPHGDAARDDDTGTILDTDELMVEFNQTTGTDAEGAAQANLPTIQVTGQVDTGVTVVLDVSVAGSSANPASVGTAATDDISGSATISVGAGTYANQAFSFPNNGAFPNTAFRINDDAVIEPTEQITIDTITGTIAGRNNTDAANVADVDGANGAVGSTEYNITDNDNLNVEISTAASMDTEDDIAVGGGNLPQLRVTGEIQAGHSVTISTADLTVNGGGTTAVTGGALNLGMNDYDAIANTTIGAGDHTNALFPIAGLAINADTVIEPDETIQIDLAAGTQFVLADVDGANGTTSSTTYTIVDDDLLDIEFDDTASTNDEAAAPGNLVIFSGTIQAGYTVTVPVTAAGNDFGGTVTAAVDPVAADDDYTAPTALMITSADTSPIAVPTFAIDDDTLIEPTEGVRLTITAPGGTDDYQIADVDTADGAVGSHDYSITDNDLLSVEFDTTASTTAENVGTVPSLRLTGTIQAGHSVDVNITAAGDTFGGTVTAAVDPVAADQDYDAPGATNVDSGEDGTSVTLTLDNFAVNNDTLIEPTEGVLLTIATPGASDQYQIVDVDTADGVEITHQLTITDDDLLDIEFDTSGTSNAEDATPGDLLIFSGTIQAGHTVNVPITAAGDTFGGTVTAAVDPVAADDDYVAPTTLAVTSASASPIAVPTFAVDDDTLIEPSEGVLLTITAPGAMDQYQIVDVDTAEGVLNTHEYTITDNDVLQVEFDTTSSTTAENVGTVPQLLVNGTIQAGHSVDINVSAAGNDFSGTVTAAIATDFTAPGMTNVDDTEDGTPATVTLDNFAVTNDMIVEPTEGIRLTIDAPGAMDQYALADVDGSTATDETHDLTVTDDDSLIVEFSTAAVTLAEDATTGLPQLRISGELQEDHTVTVTLSHTENTATEPEDYTAPASTVIDAVGGNRVADGANAASLIDIMSLALVNDTLIEPDEDFDIDTIGGTQVSPGDAGGGDGDVQSSTITIDDNDLAEVVFVNATSSASESNATQAIGVQLNLTANGTAGTGSLQDDLMVDVNDLMTGTASIGSTAADAYVQATQTAGQAGLATGTATVVTNWTESLDSAGTFDPTTGVFTATKDGTYLVTGRVNFVGTPANASTQVFLNGAIVANAEGADTAGTASLVVNLSAGDTVDLRGFHNAGAAAAIDTDGNFFNISLLAENTANNDYTFTDPTVLTFTAGSMDGAVENATVTIVNDAIPEPDETVNLDITFTNAVSNNFTIGTPGGHTFTIRNDDTRLSIDDVRMVEGDAGTTNFEFTITRTDNVNTVTFTVATSDDTAEAGTDYTSTTTNFTLDAQGGANDGLTATFTVPITVDTTVEKDESFFVTISAETNADVITRTGTGRIDNDDSATLSIAATGTVSEGNTGLAATTYTATLSNPVDTTVLATYDVAGSGADAASLGDGDLFSTGGVVSFGPGETTATVTVLTGGDNQVEADETYDVTLNDVLTSDRDVSIDMANDTGTGTITNDDMASVSINDVSVNEGDSGTTALTFTVSIDKPAAEDITVTANSSAGTATGGGNDYADVSAQSVVIMAGDTSATLTVNVTGDTALESNETFTITLSNPLYDGATDASRVVLGDATGTGTILNDEPDALDDNAVTLEDTAVTIQVLENDINPLGETLAVTIGTTNNGSATANADGSITYTPNADFNGTDTFTYSINGTDDTATVTVSVAAVNDQPSVTLGANPSVAEDSGTSTTAAFATPSAGGGADENGQTFTYEVSNNNHDLFTTGGQPALDANGQLTFTPASNANGTATVTVAVRDSGGVANGGTDTSSVSTFTITVTAVNDDPVPVADVATTLEDQAVTINVLGNDSDVDGDTLTVATGGSAPSAANGTVTINADNTLQYTPNADFNGTDTITYSVTDGTSTVASSVSVNVIAVNDQPSVALGANPSVAEDSGTSTTAAFATPSAGGGADENGQTFTYEVSNNNHDLFTTGGQPALDANGQLTFTPASNANGTATVTVAVRDSGGVANGGTDTSSVSTFTITVTAVNDDPVPVADVATTLEDQAVTINVLGNDSDVDGDTLTVATGGSAPSAANGTVTINSDNTLQYTPNADFNGTDTITYSVTDGTSTVASSVSVNVIAVNDQPAFTTLGDQAVLEDSGAATISGFIDSLTLGPVDEQAGGANAQAVADWFLSTDNGELFSMQPDVASGDLTFTPAANANGVAVVNIFLQDDGGLANGGEDTSLVASFTITVTPVNDQPVAGNDFSVTLEDTDVTIQVLENDSDIDGDSLTVTNATSSEGTVTINADNSLTFSPNADFNGTATINYTIDDGSGAGNATDTATVTIEVDDVNDQPTFTTLGDQTVLEDSGAATISGFINSLTLGPADELAGGANAQAVADWFLSTDNGELFSMQPDVAAGDLTFTPAANANGVAVVDIFLQDDGGVDLGGEDTSPVASFTITVTPVNDDPIIGDSNPTVGGAPGSVNLTVVEDQDEDGQISATDIDGDSLTYSVTTPATLGAVAIDAANGQFVYTPNANANGSDSFVVTVSDGNGGSDTTTVNVDLQSVNDEPEANEDAYSVDEDQTLTVNAVLGVLNNDSDPFDSPANNLSVQVVNSPLNGSVTLNMDGSFTYIPNADFTGTDTFTYEIEDDGGIANGGDDIGNTTEVTITVNPVNDNPVIADDSGSLQLTAVEDQTEDGQVFASDIDGDNLTFSATQPGNGSVTINSATGQYTYSPNANFNGADTFTVTVTDDGTGNLTDTTTINVTVQSVNDEPEANEDNYSVNEDSTLTVNAAAGVLNNDNDPNDSPANNLSVQVVNSPANGTVSLNLDGSFTYTPDADFNGVDTFTYEIEDDGGIANGGDDIGNTTEVTITVNPVNDDPIIADDGASLQLVTNEDVPVNGVALASDIDGDSLTFSNTAAANGTVNLDTTSGEFSYTPNANFNGSDTFTITVDDGNSGTDTTTVNVTVNSVNDEPLAADDAYSVNEDATLTVAAGGGVLANDSDPADSPANVLSAAVVNGPRHGTLGFSSDGSFTYTPAADFNGTDRFTYVLGDDGGIANGGDATGSAAEVVITVNSIDDAPVATNDSMTTLEDTWVTFEVLNNDFDVDGDPLSVTMATALNGTVIINPDSSLSYTPDADFNGTDTITYTLSDGTPGDEDTADVTVEVSPVNDQPSFTVSDVVVNEDSGATNLTGFVTGIDKGAADESAQTMSWNVETNRGDLFLVQPDISGGDLSFVVAGNANGVATVSVHAVDSGGIDNGGEDTSATMTFTITLTPVNDIPMAAPVNLRTLEDTVVNGQVFGTDIDGDSLSYSITTPANNGLASIDAATGQIRYEPDLDFHSDSGTPNDTFTVTVDDGNGGTTTSLVTVIVDSVNDAPNATADTASVDEDASVMFNVLTNDDDANDVDADNAAGDNLLAVLINSPNNGSVTLNMLTGDATYTPDPDFFGIDTFTYVLHDDGGRAGGGTPMGNPVEVTITVNPLQDPPEIRDQVLTTTEDDPVNSVIFADDPDGDVLTFAIAANPANGSASVDSVTGHFTYTPDQHFNGTDTFDISVDDGNGNVVSATVTVNVVAEDDLPVATADSYSVNEDATLSMNAAGGVLTNDNDPSDVGHTLSASLVSGANNGSVSLNADGSFSYTPNPDFVGVDTFSYQLSDDNGTPGDATDDINGNAVEVTITVNPVNDAPETEDASVTTNEETPVNGFVEEFDIDGDTVTLSVTTPASNGTATVDASSGEFVYLPNDNFVGSDSFVVTVDDGNGGTATSTISVEVLPVYTVSISSAVDPESASLDFVVSLDKPAPSDISVLVSTADGSATAGSDYTAITNQTVTIAAGTTQSIVSVAVTDDNLVEDNETVLLTANTPTFAGTGSVILSESVGGGVITDNDVAQVDISSEIGLEDAGPLTFTVTLSNPVDVSTLVQVRTIDDSAVGGEDFTDVTANVTFGAGVQSVTFSVPITSDSEVERDEDFFVEVSSINASGRAVVDGIPGVGTIDNDDTGPMTIRGLAFEGAGGAPRVFRDGEDIRVVDPITGEDVQPPREFASVTNIVVTARDNSDDNLVLDFGSGDILPAGGIDYDGGDNGNDSIELINGTFALITHNFASSSSGSIDLDGQLITYSDLEPITDSLTATDRAFNFTSAVDDATLGDDGTAANGTIQISSTSTSETTTFAQPSGTITVNLGGGDDSLVVGDLDGFAGMTFVNAGTGNDDVDGSGTSNALTLNGDDGDDILAGGSGDDFINGGLGDDVVDGGGGVDNLDGGAGTDTARDMVDGTATITDAGVVGAGGTSVNVEAIEVSGGTGDDVLDASGATIPVILRGGGGDDQLFGGSGNDQLFGDDGNDFILGNPGDDAISGGNDDDVLLGGGGMDNIAGDDGDDVINGQGAVDVLDGGLGIDNITDNASGSFVIDDIEGTAVITNTGFTTDRGDNVSVDSLAQATIKGGAGDDVIDGQNYSISQLVLIGNGGNDILIGGQFDDVVLGGDGDDVLLGAGGKDAIDGGAGNDQVNGGGAADIVGGGEGDDLVDGGTGDNTLREVGDGATITVVSNMDGTVVVTGLGTDTHQGIFTKAIIVGGDSDQVIDVTQFNGDTIIVAGGGNDIVRGGIGQDIIDGGTGDDMLFGNDGPDIMNGRDGDDDLQGGAGPDELIGGAGDDALEGGTGNDEIFGEEGDDRIDGGDGTDDLAGGGNGIAASPGDIIVGDPTEIDENINSIIFDFLLKGVEL